MFVTVKKALVTMLQMQAFALPKIMEQSYPPNVTYQKSIGPCCHCCASSLAVAKIVDEGLDGHLGLHIFEGFSKGVEV